MKAYKNHSEEYCIYLRKSRLDMEAESHGGGDTLERHRRALLELAQRAGLPITHIYQEVVSGETIAARPEMNRLLHDVELGRWKGVLCMEVERLARGNTSDQGLVADTFQYSDTSIVTPMKTYDPSDEFDQEFFEFGLFRSRMEYKTINRRLQRGRLASLSEGKYIAGKAAYGYERFKLPGQKGYSLQVVPEQAEVVRRIFQWYAGGELRPDGGRDYPGVSAIAGRLNAQGIPSPSGGKWPPCTVAAILKNPTYIGKVRWSHRPTVKRMVDGKRVVTRPVDDGALLTNGLHAPILEQALWDRAQAVLRARAKSPAVGNPGLRNPLAGLVRCARCGHGMERRSAPRGRDTLVCPTKGCGCVSSVLEEVEAGILEALRVWLPGLQVRLEVQPPGAPSGAELQTARLRRSLAALERQREALYPLVEQGLYTPEIFAARALTLSQKIEDAERELAALSAQLEVGRRLETFEAHPHTAAPLDVYSALTRPEEKNALLKELLAVVIYDKTTGGRWAKGDMVLSVFPKLGPLP